MPSDQEWSALTDYLGGDLPAVGKLREADTTHWVYENPEMSNSSGFTALPGGYRSWTEPKYFSELGYSATFWTATENTGNSVPSANCRRITYSYHSGELWPKVYPKEAGFSVRCVKDN